MNFMNKKNLILGGVLATLIVVAFLYQIPYKNWKKNYAKPDNFLAGINFSNINKIEIIKNNEVVVIEQKDDKWQIKDTRAFFVKPEVINEIKTSLEEADKAKVSLVSSNSDNKGSFEVDEENGTKIKLVHGEDVLANFVIGKSTSDFLGTYISQIASDKTYSIQISLDRTFIRDDWYDKEIFAVEKSGINKVRFQYGEDGFTVEKNEDTWVGLVPFKFKVTAEKIEGILDIMSNLNSAEIPSQAFEGTGLEKNAIIVQATGEGIDNTIMVGDDNGEELYYAKKSANDNIYLITKEQRDELKKGYRDLQ